MLLWVVFWLVVSWSGSRLGERGLAAMGLGLVILSVIPFLMVIYRVVSSVDRLFGSFVFWAGVVGIIGIFLIVAAVVLRVIVAAVVRRVVVAAVIRRLLFNHR